MPCCCRYSARCRPPMPAPTMPIDFSMGLPPVHFFARLDQSSRSRIRNDKNKTHSGEEWMDRIDALQTFIRVMEAGSFTQAAADLGLGQPAITKRIALLEEQRSEEHTSELQSPD